MLNFLTKLSKWRYSYEPLITVEISKSRLLHNFNEFRKLAPDGRVAPVLKSNAYGHGLIEIARIIEEEANSHLPVIRQAPNIEASISPTPFIVVDSYFEAVALRAKGIKTHILIIGYVQPEIIAKSRGAKTAFTITSMETLRKLNEITASRFGSGNLDDTTAGKLDIFKPLRFPRYGHLIHLKIDTGMHRQGILPEELPNAIDMIKNNTLLVLEGVTSHFSDADNADTTFTENQIAIWNKCVTLCREAFPKLRYWHISNTDGHTTSTNAIANSSRLGIGLFGISDNKEIATRLNLLPAMELKTIITSIKKLSRGESVGYGNTFTAEKDMLIATIPVGYYEAIDRRLSNQGCVLVGENRSVCPIIGRVSMNITSIDVTNLPKACIGTPVTVISNIPNDPNSITSIARMCNTIAYDIAVHIPAHLKKIIVK